jgi:ATP/maltotriose-dependent transcriptional regulator MalT
MNFVIESNDILGRIAEALGEQSLLQIEMLAKFNALSNGVQQELHGIQQSIERLRDTLKSGPGEQGAGADPVSPESGAVAGGKGGR